jgi:GNAT superfamily N-acetyltransferase
MLLLYNKSIDFKKHLRFEPLSYYRERDFAQYQIISEQIISWNFSEWGYLLKERKKSEDFMENYFQYYHLLFFKNSLVGAFVVIPQQDLLGERVYCLDGVYIDPKFRSLGIGNLIVEHVKELCRGSIVVLDTLKPGLNHFYKKHGATIVGEHYWATAPAERLAFRP